MVNNKNKKASGAINLGCGSNTVIFFISRNTKKQRDMLECGWRVIWDDLNLKTYYSLLLN